MKETLSNIQCHTFFLIQKWSIHMAISLSIKGSHYFNQQFDTVACACTIHYMLTVACIPSGQLTLEDLSEVRGALYEARAKWYDIGIELRLSIGTLNTIREDFPQAADCLREICIHWLKRTDPRPSWTALSVVLESPPVGEGHLAQRLRAKYCRGEEVTLHVSPTPVSSPPGAPPTSQGSYCQHILALSQLEKWCDCQ